MTIDKDQLETAELKARLLGSFVLFVQTFYKLRTGRDFEITKPFGRESHIITICRELTLVKNLSTLRLLINVEPGSGKSELMRHFVAWCFAHYPDCNFIYTSYSKSLAMENTSFIKQIIELAAYQKLFGITLKDDTTAKAHFKTNADGAVYAAGSSGTITGFDAGFPMCDRFSGALIGDDMHKPDEAMSDVIREGVKENYRNTLIHRVRAPNVPFIFIGQRTHQDDLPGALLNGFDGYHWKSVILESRDEDGNILNPRVHNKEFLDNLQKFDPYTYSTQYQQNPAPLEGGIIPVTEFVKFEDEPIFNYILQCWDTAFKDKEQNDYSVGLTIGVSKKGFYILDRIKERMQYPKLKQEIKRFAYKHNPDIIIVEDKASGQSVIQDLQTNSQLPIVAIAVDTDKVTRAIATTGEIASYRVYISDKTEDKVWVSDFIENLRLFPNGKHDDDVDAFSLGINYLSKRFSNSFAVYPDYNDNIHSVEIARIDDVEFIQIIAGIHVDIICSAVVIALDFNKNIYVIWEAISESGLSSLINFQLKPYINKFYSKFKVDYFLFSEIEERFYDDILSNAGVDYQNQSHRDINTLIDNIKSLLTRLNSGQPLLSVVYELCPDIREGFIGAYAYKARDKATHDFNMTPIKNKYSRLHTALQVALIEYSNIIDDNIEIEGNNQNDFGLNEDDDRSWVGGY